MRPYGLLVFERVEWAISPRRNQRAITQTNEDSKGSNKSIEEVAYSGVLSAFAKRKLRKAISLMVAIARDKEAPNFKTGNMFKFKVNFITLTLPSEQGTISDKEIKSGCLDPFIKRMKRKHKLNSYVWRAERQKNGNIHFHIITDTYIHYQHLRNDWNACLNKFDFIEKFYLKNGHRNPNSTDVHAIWKVKNLVAYFVKYMSKTTTAKDVIQGKVWDCSNNLKSKDSCEVLLEGDYLDIWNRAKFEVTSRVIDDPNFSIVLLNKEGFEKFVIGNLKANWEQYLERLRTYSRSSVSPCDSDPKGL